MASTGRVTFHDLEPEPDDFETAVIEGLGQGAKSLPSKFFYDRAGSRLFDRICDLEEYYPTRTEIALLERHRGEIADIVGSGCHVIELGSGSGVKTRILLGGLTEPAAYTAVDISKEHLLEATNALALDFPAVHVFAMCADYTRPFDVPAPPGNPGAKRVGFFPGSTIGNLTPPEAVDLLATIGDLLDGGDLLIGVDLEKDGKILTEAYNDREGVTAAFNMNLLARINRELDGDFDLDRFVHEAIYNEEEGRIEMHLVSLDDQGVSIGGRVFEFCAGETIHTENSYKFAVEDFHDLGRRAGFSPVHVWTDRDSLFSVHYLRASPRA